MENKQPPSSVPKRPSLGQYSKERKKSRVIHPTHDNSAHNSSISIENDRRSSRIPLNDISNGTFNFKLEICSIPFKFQRRQFPLLVCFAMTINKSQGQSLSNVGLFFRQPVFTHGQLYVAVSRVKSKEGLKVLICDDEGNPTNKTMNVVYKEVLQKI